MKHWKTTLAAGGVAVLLLSGCGLDLFSGEDNTGALVTPPVTSDPNATPFLATPSDGLDGLDTCGRTTLMDFVGQMVDVIPPALIPAGSRVYETGAMLTMDYRLDRINIEYDPISRTVVQITCG